MQEVQHEDFRHLVHSVGHRSRRESCWKVSVSCFACKLVQIRLVLIYKIVHTQMRAYVRSFLIYSTYNGEVPWVGAKLSLRSWLIPSACVSFNFFNMHENDFRDGDLKRSWKVLHWLESWCSITAQFDVKSKVIFSVIFDSGIILMVLQKKCHFSLSGSLL